MDLTGQKAGRRSWSTTRAAEGRGWDRRLACLVLHRSVLNRGIEDAQREILKGGRALLKRPLAYFSGVRKVGRRPGAKARAIE